MQELDLFLTTRETVACSENKPSFEMFIFDGVLGAFRVKLDFAARESDAKPHTYRPGSVANAPGTLSTQRSTIDAIHIRCCPRDDIAHTECLD